MNEGKINNFPGQVEFSLQLAMSEENWRICMGQPEIMSLVIILLLIILLLSVLALIWLQVRLRKYKADLYSLTDKARYLQDIFSNMQEGFALHEMLYDKKGEPVDYRFLDGNRAFEEITGLNFNDIRNRTVLDVLPHIEKYWMQKYGEVASTGKSSYYENYSRELGKHFLVNVYSPERGKFATLFSDITHHVLLKEKLNKEKCILEGILEDTLSGYWDWDLINNMEYLSPAFKEMFGYKDDELPNSPQTWQKLIYKEDLEGVLERFRKHVESKGVFPFYNEVRYKHKNGSAIWVICSGRVVEWNEAGQPARMVGCHINITRLKELERELNVERELLKTTLMSMGDAVISTDSRGRVVLLNSVAELLTGWSQSDAEGKPFDDVFRIVNEESGEVCIDPVRQVLDTGEVITLANHTVLISKDRKRIPIEDSAAPIRDCNGNIQGVVVVFRDYSEKKEKQDRIEYLSYHDQLTGLYNRRFFEEELNRLDTERNLPISIVMADVNGLKLTNDAFGHALGDQLLKKAADTIRYACRADDIISRIGGDEFTVILPKTGPGDAERVINRIEAAMKEQKVNSLELSISFGWETKKDASQAVEEILKKAEDNMYREKLVESPKMRSRMVRMIIEKLNSENQLNPEHEDRMNEICQLAYCTFGMKEAELQQFKLSFMLRDVGEVAIEDGVLNKAGRLSEGEWQEIRRHPEIGYRILSSVSEYSNIANIVLAHHERWNGTGYPKGLKGEEIPLIARIIAVFDAFDAMTGKRTYRETITEDEALAEIGEKAGSQFDPQVAELFIQAVRKYRTLR